MPETKSQNPPPKRRRARQSDGTYKGSNPDTKGHDEAWEPTPIEESLPKKENKYKVKPRVGGTSQASAGKYSKKPKVRPTFGNVTSTLF